MDKLWAPWRVKYVTKLIGKTKTNIFGRIAKSKNDRKNLVFVRTRLSYSVLNLYPYNNGHALVIPVRGVTDLKKLTREEREDLFDLLEYTKELLDEVLKPAGYNIGINLGREAGAGFPRHLHIHIVPRWKGDVNFMPVITGTKIISQSLARLYELLVAAHHRRRSRKKDSARMRRSP